MRRQILAASVLVSAAALLVANAGFFSSSSPAQAQAALPESMARACDGRCDSAWMDANLRLDQLQMVGTGESYKQRPSPALMSLIRMGGKKDAEALDFGQPSLAEQLDHDVRALSFDIAYDPKGGLFRNPAGASMAMELLDDAYVSAMKRPGFKAIHVLDVDYASSCLALADCLKQVSDWSRAHPRHLPIVITLRTNDVKTPIPGATRPLAFDEAAMNALELEILSTFTPDRIITPDQVQGSHATLRAAALAHAWPRLGAARGKVIFVLEDSPAKVKAYQGGRRSLEGRVMFTAVEEDSPLAAFVTIRDPRREAVRIAAAVQAGFIVKTRADEQTREARSGDGARRDAAFASGAQIVETDFATPDPAIGAYHVSLAGSPRALCGPALASESCLGLAQSAPRTTVTAALP